MTIELTEKDIKAIARERAKASNKMLWGILGLAIVWLGASIWADPKPYADMVLCIGGVVVIAVILPFTIASSRKERRILKQLKQEHGE